MPTISANIKWATNLEELRKELKSGTDQLVVLQKAAERTERNLGGEGLIRAANNAAVAIQKLGGVSGLTAKEQDKINSLMGRTIEKMEALNKAAAEAGKPLITIPTAFKQIYEQTTRVEAPVSRINTLFTDLGKQLVGTAAGFVSAQAIIGTVQGAFRTLTGFVVDSVKAYAAAEVASKKLSTALLAQGNSTPDVIEQYNKLAATFQKTTVYSDDLINEMEALLVQVGNVAPSQMEAALTAATDLASGLGIDLRTATLLVGKAFEGETGTLKRYGIVIDEAKLKAEGFPAVLEAIQQKFGGQAQAEIETYTGRVEQLKNAWNNLQEAIGKNVANDPAVIAMLRIAAQDAQKAADGQGNWNIALATYLQLMPDWLRSLKDAHADLNEIALIENVIAESTDRMNAVKPPSVGMGGLKPLTEGLDLAQKAWEKELEAEKKAKEAAEAHAKAIQTLTDRLSGAGVIKAAQDYAAALARIGDISKLTPAAQDEIRKSMQAAIDVFVAAGKDIPANVQRIYDSLHGLGALIPVVDGLGATVGDTIKELSMPFQAWNAIPIVDGLKAVDGEWNKIGIDIPKATAKGVNGLHDLSQALSQLAQISGDAFGGIVRDLATLVAAADTATKSVGAIQGGFKKGGWSGILEGMSGILGIASAAIQAGKAIASLFDRNKGRDAVVQFAVSMGGFDALHAQLAKLDVDGKTTGEDLWKLLTQGTGTNNPEQAAANIKKVQDALANLPATMGEKAAAAGFQTQAQLKQIAADAVKLWEYMRDSGEYSAEVVQQAWQKAQDALAASGDTTSASVKQAQDAVSALDDEIKSLQASVDSEAPEEFMGIVEQQQRAKLADLKAQREEAAKTLEDLTQQMTDSMREVADAINKLPDELNIRLNVDWNVPNMPAPTRDAAAVEGLSTGGIATASGRLLHFPMMVPVQHFATGGTARIAQFIPKGQDNIPAMLRAGESVFTPEQMANLLGHLATGGSAIETLQRLSGGSGGAAPLTSVTVLQVDKRELGRVLAVVLPGEARRLGVRVRA